jgi:hypothetical protein
MPDNILIELGITISTETTMIVRQVQAGGTP